MLKMTLNSSEALLEERKRIEEVLMSELGRAPKGCKLDQLVAKIWKQPNFETALALSKRSDDSDRVTVAVSAALNLLELSDLSRDIVDKIINEIKNSKAPIFVDNHEETMHKICLICIYHVVSSRYSHLSFSKDCTYQQFWIDNDCLKAATRWAGYEFYNHIATFVDHWYRTSSAWYTHGGAAHPDCKLVARVTYDTMILLKKALSNHSLVSKIEIFERNSAKQIYSLFFMNGFHEVANKIFSEGRNKPLLLNGLAKHVNSVAPLIGIRDLKVKHLKDDSVTFTRLSDYEGFVFTDRFVLTLKPNGLQIRYTLTKSKGNKVLKVAGDYKGEFRDVSMLDEVFSAHYHGFNRMRHLKNSLVAGIDFAIL
ncbi:hypothetical protein B9J93_00015 [Vibrio sp. V17_P4S1T151]|uniref:hypothetical protein n=1 Tax=unclassified Vibrio TaxID=2614977 RepID=UPI000B8E401D|nr:MULTISPECIES: hypothetical protein [unclassified Vibrio]OXX50543.1 hypothetical protein B9J93_00015 [Vibrio sp. V17_P4S1T151]OXX64404.1 hypothetical protein B9J89_00415 [Vibrio sp. V15_P4S5T153]